MIALQLQAKLLMYIHVLPNVFTYLNTLKFRPDSNEQLNAARLVKLLRLAQDLTVTPASHAYYEQILSICGELTAGRRNGLMKTVYTRRFL